MGAGANGSLKVEFKSHMKLFPNMAIQISFNGESVQLTRGNQHSFIVPADGKTRTCQIACYHGIFDSSIQNFTIQSGERKAITIIFDDTRFGTNKWQYREERF